jgi:hypothetical protein
MPWDRIANIWLIEDVFMLEVQLFVISFGLKCIPRLPPNSNCWLVGANKRGVLPISDGDIWLNPIFFNDRSGDLNMLKFGAIIVLPRDTINVTARSAAISNLIIFMTTLTSTTR